MPENENITENPIAGGNKLGSSDGNKTAVPVPGAEEPQEFKDVIKQITGKEFPDNESAVKSIQDTYAYVGKAGQVEKENKDLLAKINGGAVDNDKYISKEQYSSDMFYEKNPELQSSRPIIDAYCKNNNVSIKEAIESDGLKPILDKIKIAENVEKSKSVLETNPIIGKVKDNIQESREKIANGDLEGAKKSAMNAVLDAFPQD